MIEQCLANFRRQVGFGVVEKGGDVVMQRAFAASLIVEEVQLALVQHDVERLKIAIEKIVVGSGQKEFCKARKIIL